MTLYPSASPAEYIFTIVLYSEECKTVVEKLMNESLSKHEFACFFQKDLEPPRIDLDSNVPKISLQYKNYHDAHGKFCKLNHGHLFNQWASAFVESLPKQYYKFASFSSLRDWMFGWVKEAEQAEENKSPEQPNKIIEIPMP